LSAFKEKLTGSASFFEEPQYATPSLVTGTEPGWWSLEMGGLALLSEGLRRFIPHKRNQINYVNPLPTTLPSWLPHGDQYFLDFGKADIFTKVKEPWARLPGAGFAQLNPEVKGLDSEAYPTFYRFKVLADLAPWSMEYGEHNKLITSEIAANRLTPQQIMEVDQIRKQVNETKRNKDFQEYRYDSDRIKKVRVKVTEELGPGVYLTDTFGTAPVIMAGVDTSQLALATVAMQRGDAHNASQALAVQDRKRAQTSDFLRQYVKPGSEIDVFVHRDPSLMIEAGPGGQPQVQAVMSVGGLNLNRALVENGLAQETKTSELLDASIATSGSQRMFGAFYERLMHGAETPLESLTPFGPISKFVHQRTALEEYQRSEVYSKDVAMWQTPVSSFLAPGLQTVLWWAGWRGLPNKVKERYMIEEYFDRLQYLKYQRLQREAESKGRGGDAAAYSVLRTQTKTGADKYSEFGPGRALSSKEKTYYKAFVDAPTAEERREISQVVSPQMQQILEAQWSRKAAEAAQLRGQAGISQPGDQRLIDTFNLQRGEYGSQQEQEFVSPSMPRPHPSWIGWSAEADLEDYKVKAVVDSGLDIHDFNLWQDDLNRVNRRPWVGNNGPELVDESRQTISPTVLRRRFNTGLGRVGSRSPSLFLSAGSDNSINVRSPGHDRVNR
jgi:hypothetical protein